MTSQRDVTKSFEQPAAAPLPLDTNAEYQTASRSFTQASIETQANTRFKPARFKGQNERGTEQGLPNSNNTSRLWTPASRG